MNEWRSEDEIKAQLRELTDATRKLRGELEAMMRSTGPKPERQHLHRQTWPTTAPAVNDRPRRRKKP